MPLIIPGKNMTANLVPFMAEIRRCFWENLRGVSDVLLCKGRQKGGFRRPYWSVREFAASFLMTTVVIQKEYGNDDSRSLLPMPSS